MELGIQELPKGYCPGIMVDIFRGEGGGRVGGDTVTHQSPWVPLAVDCRKGRKLPDDVLCHVCGKHELRAIVKKQLDSFFCFIYGN